MLRDGIWTRPKVSVVHIQWMAFVQVRGLNRDAPSRNPQGFPPTVHKRARRCAQVVHRFGDGLLTGGLFDADRGP